MTRFWLGGYAAGMNGRAEGISSLDAGEADSGWASGPLGWGGTVVAAPGSPSWLAAHPTLDVVYAALEGDGTVQAYTRTAETALVRTGRPVEAGAAVCHLAVSPDGAYLLASCWGDGRLVRVRLDERGALGTASVAPAAVDPYATGDAAAAIAPPAPISGPPRSDLAAAARALRAAAGEEFAAFVPEYEEPAVADGAAPAASAGRVSRTHQAAFLPGGLVATTDLGYDLVRIWRSVDGGLRSAQNVVLPQGSGPRHMLWHPSGHLYVLTEFSCEVFVLAADRAGVWRLVSGTALSPLVNFGSDTGAHLDASRDGTFLYAGVRGTDALATVRVTGDGGVLAPVAFTETGTRGPRHHVIVRDTALIAGKPADEVVSLPLDERTGIPGRARFRTTAPSPSCLLPVR